MHGEGEIEAIFWNGGATENSKKYIRVQSEKIKDFITKNDTISLAFFI